MFEFNPACPIYFPLVGDIHYEPFTPHTARIDQVWACSDLVQFQLYFPGGIPAGLEALIGVDTFAPVTYDGTIAYWSIDVSGYCGQTIQIGINWTAAEAPVISEPMTVTDADDCLNNTVLITYTHTHDGWVGNTPYKATLPTTARLRAYYEFARNAYTADQRKTYAGASVLASSQADRIYSFTVPHIGGAAWVHGLVSSFWIFSSIAIKRWRSGYDTNEPETLTFQREGDYTYNAGDKLDPEDIAEFAGTGTLRLIQDRTLLTLC